MPVAIGARLHLLFAGLERAHGVYRPSNSAPNARGKVEGRQGTDRTPATLELWQKHLAGEQGLGVYMLRDDGTVRFAALDVDVYPLDHARLALRIKEAKLPLIVCKSKSGGAHLYLFGKDDLPALIVRQRLIAWAALLGLPKFEVYPHKDRLDNERDLGKYLNMPYFGDERFAIGDNGKRLTIEGFLAWADKYAVTADGLQALKINVEDALMDGPPCLQALLAQGPVSEYRNSTLINLGVYLRQRYPDTWEGKLEEYNQTFMTDALGAKEVIKIQRSLAKKDYNYSCQQEPIVSHCNSTICIGRKFGVRAKAAENGKEVGFDLNLGTLTRYMSDPVTWELDVDGVTLRLTTQQLKNYRAFTDACLENLAKYPPMLKEETWRTILAEKLAKVVTVQAPTDAGRSGALRWHLERFCLNLRARAKEELKDGRPWWGEARIFFRLPHFKQHLEKMRVFWSERELASQFRAWDFQHHEFNFRNVFVSAWSLPEFKTQTEPDSVPRTEQGSEM